ncbi:UNVERIFIED_CONTAM: hypothetical protein NCL1_48659 [Trichonephila clavipes]
MTGWVSTSGTLGSNLKSETRTGAKILNSLMSMEIIITGRADREGSNEPGANGLSGSGAEILAKKL